MRKQRRKRQLKIVKHDCYFCKSKQEPYWRDYEELANYLSPRSRIKARLRTGVCAKHQRRLSEAIKHARHLGLLPFITEVKK